MPTYEYACTKCGQHVEVFQRLSEPPLTECGVCGGPLRKVFHPVGIVFKGSGFYATDSRSKPKTDTDARSGSGDGGKEARSGSGDGGKEARSGSGDAGKEAPSAPPSSSSSSTSSESGSTSAPKRASGEKAS
jgi:putative FmdB family regulatory protein